MNVEARVDNFHAAVKVYRPVISLAALAEDLRVTTVRVSVICSV